MARVKGILEDLHGRLDDNFTICHRGDTTFTRPAHIRQPHRLSRKQLLIRERQSHNNALWRALKESGHVYFEANKPAYNHFMAINMQSPVPYIPKQQFHSGNALLLPGMVLSDGPSVVSRNVVYRVNPNQMEWKAFRERSSDWLGVHGFILSTALAASFCGKNSGFHLQPSQS